MKKILICILLFFAYISISAQIPYFASTAGNGNLYGYTSIKFRPGKNAQETYTTFQYGLGKYIAAGLDIYTSQSSAYSGFLLRAGYKFNKWFGIGAQATPSFNLGNNFKFSYFTGGIYIDGNISNNGKFFWCSNTWFNINDGTPNSYMNWEYVGMNISIKEGQGISPMIGMIHSWEFNQDIDLALGAYYSIDKWNIYLWSNDLLKKNPRLVVGVDFKL